jgi:hypothetical protein
MTEKRTKPRFSAALADKVVAFVCSTPGCRIGDVMRSVGASESTVAHALRYMTLAQRIEMARIGQSWRYYPPGQGKQARLEQNALDRVRRSIIEAGRCGASNVDLRSALRLPETAVSYAIRRLRTNGEIVRVGAGHGALWFDASLGITRLPERAAAKQLARGGELLRARKIERDGRVPKPQAARALKPQAVSPEVIVPANVKVTVGPSVSYDPRFQVPEGTRIVGGWATAGMGRYL